MTRLNLACSTILAGGIGALVGGFAPHAHAQSPIAYTATITRTHYDPSGKPLNVELETRAVSRDGSTVYVQHPMNPTEGTTYTVRSIHDVSKKLDVEVVEGLPGAESKSTVAF